MLSRLDRLVAGEAEVVGLQIVDELVDVLGRLELGAQPRLLLGLGFDGQLLQAVDAAAIFIATMMPRSLFVNTGNNKISGWLSWHLTK